MKTADTIIIGGGIAGLASAYHLARAGRRVRLLEREPLLASHSSGRNAAIFRTLDASAGVLQLAQRSRALLDDLFAPRRERWLEPTGAIFAARTPAALEPSRRLAAAHGVEHRLLGAAELRARVPELALGGVEVGIEIPGDGVMDIHAITTALAEEARRAGALITTRAEATDIRVEAGRVRGVALASGEQLEADCVIIAAGAWSASLGERAAAALPLRPLRRHLALLDVPGGSRAGAPVIWALDDEAYFRPESGGMLCSPCDEDAYEPCLPPESPHAIELLAEKLARIAPPLAQLGVRRAWACLRTFAPDRALVAGADPRAAGLYWLAGLGGHGMTAGVAAAELLADAVLGRASPLAAALAPARLLG